MLSTVAQAFNSQKVEPEGDDFIVWLNENDGAVLVGK